MTSREACAILDKTPYSKRVSGIAPTDTLYAYIWEVDPDHGWPTFYALLTTAETSVRLIIVNTNLPVGRQTVSETYPLNIVNGIDDLMIQMAIDYEMKG